MTLYLCKIKMSKYLLLFLKNTFSYYRMSTWQSSKMDHNRIYVKFVCIYKARLSLSSSLHIISSRKYSKWTLENVSMVILAFLKSKDALINFPTVHMFTQFRWNYIISAEMFIFVACLTFLWRVIFIIICSWSFRFGFIILFIFSASFTFVFTVREIFITSYSLVTGSDWKYI